ncbi:MAG TPA: DMT family transporter, partial [bacterium]|nr:DMT family transporter [bacterium]
LLVHGIPFLQPGVWTYCLLFAITQIIGTQLLSLALHRAEISLVTAVWKLSVILLVVWGFLALGERPSLLGTAGVLLSVAGVYLFNVNRARLSFWAPLAAIVRERGQLYAAASALFYAPAVVCIKKVALLSDPAFAVFTGYLFCALLITPFTLYRSGRHFRHAGRHWLGFVGMGAFAAASSLLVTTAYTMAVSAYVEAVEQVEILIALAVGCLVFHEAARVRQIWLGCVVMLAGMVLLALSQ